MNILITGASGFIGKILCDKLSKRHDAPKLSRVDISNKGMSLKLDLTDKRAVVSYFNRFKKTGHIDVIIHLASRMMSQNDMENLDVLYTNLKITEGLIEIVKITNAKKLINLSSMAAYPKIDGSFSEESQTKVSLNTDCLYGLSKICAENLIDFYLRGRNMVISHLRAAQVYGEGMRGDRLVPVFRKELSEKNVITVFAEGRRTSNFIEVEELCNIIKLFLEKDIPGVFNVGGENLSYLEMAKKVIRESGDRNSKIIKVKKGSRTRFVLDTSKLKKALKKASNNLRKQI